MIRGLYTGASGMVAQMHRMDAVSNNLANIDVTGYKRDTAVHKAFPQLLIRRMNDDGVHSFPFGSVDSMPIVGMLGTGVELNEIFTVFEQGPLKETGNVFDLALEGSGFFSVESKGEERFTRNGSFLLNNDGFLVTKGGDMVMGERGYIRLKMNNFVIDEDGNVYQNARFGDDPTRLVSIEENEWEDIELVDRLRIVDFKRTRYLMKQGNSYWKGTRESGPPEISEGDDRPKVRQSFLEGANVNPVQEMVHMIEVQRTYEANQKLIQTEDGLLGKLINEAVKA